VVRGCGQVMPPEKCYEGKSDVFQFKDCISGCDPAEDGDGCNSDLKAVSELMGEGSVTECYHCYSTQEFNGEFSGTDKCGLKPTNTGTRKCPPYADSSCFTASSYHRDYSGDKTYEVEDDYRGCSPFTAADEQVFECGSASVNGFDHVNCKATCDSRNCNKEKSDALGEIRLQCYTCSASRDSAGNSVGVSDDRCFEGLSSDFLQACSSGQVCRDDLMADWFPKGDQQFTIIRGCWTPNNQNEVPEPSCIESSSAALNFEFRDCVKYCDESYCNQDMSIGDLHSSPNNIQSCHTCSYNEVGDDREGLPSCLFNSSPNRPKNCPNYANHGCFTANNILVDGDLTRSAIRGCSAFTYKNSRNCYDANIPDADGNEVHWGVCKEFCVGHNCNNQKPASPELGNQNWPSCMVCQTTVNDRNETVGLGDGQACWDPQSEADIERFTQKCPNANDNCIVDMMADWFPRGHHQYVLTRKCSNEATPRFCSEGSSSLMQYKDCKARCNPLADGTACNNDLHAVSQLFSQGRVSSCHQCEFYQQQDGNVAGFPDCADQSTSSTYQKDCPAYADSSCYEAASFHDHYTTAEPDFEEDFRGCSPFDTAELNEDKRCAQFELNTIDHTNCRRNCYSDNCNGEPITRGKSCYTCTGTRDSQGNVYGVSDDSCWENVGPQHLKECGVDEPYCVDDMLADWVAKGQQLIQIKRGCSKVPAISPCVSGESSYMMYKDCQSSCENKEGPCNDDLSVADALRPGPGMPTIKSCLTCSYEQHDDGTVNGNRNCMTNAGIISDVQKTCPNYAESACFSAEAVHVDFGREVHQVYKGCSVFGLESADGSLNGIKKFDQALPDEAGNVVGYSVVKQTCDKNNCNEEHERPVPPQDSLTSSCLSCSVTVDQYNNTNGMGDIGCWNGDSKYMTTCGIGFQCATDLEVDWLPKGEHQFRLQRGCTANPPPLACEEVQNEYYSYKDCRVICDPMKDGQGCNKGLETVAKKFELGLNGAHVDSCYQCSYRKLGDEEFGNEDCGKQIDEVTRIPRTWCPMYANAGCYHAVSFHTDYVDGETQTEEDYRGCTPFTSSDGKPPIGNPNGNPRPTCAHMDLNNLDHENCKTVCGDDDCNTTPARQRNTCYSCSVSFDSEGKQYGAGDPRCWDVSEGANNLIQQCPRDRPVCQTEMHADWYAAGQQIVTLNRACVAEEKPVDHCVSGSSERIKYKDCYDTCVGSGTACNNDRKVEELFQNNKNYIQEQCYSCHYSTDTFGNVDGFPNCGDSPTDEDHILNDGICPLWASNACYTGSNVHYDNHTKKNVEDVFKGCSAFVIDGGVEEHQDTISEIAYSMVKETCTGKKCNKGHQKPVDPRDIKNTRANRYN